MVSFRPLVDWILAVAGDQPGGPPAEAAALPAVPAAVPGCVHTDLLAAGLIPDPYLDDNEDRLHWIGRTDWRYECAFDWDDPGSERVDLVCAGLDTVATLTLNGVPLGTTANMHRSYRFDVRDLLRPGRNHLVVRFDSVHRYAEAVRAAVGERPLAGTSGPFPYVRKMACNFGWDWGPTLVTAGIWQRIGLESWSVARLAEVRPEVTVRGDATDPTGRVTARIRVERAGDQPLTVRVAVALRPAQAAGKPEPRSSALRPAQAAVDAAIPAGESETTVVVDVPGVDLWWPRGLGEPARYDLTVTLADHDSWTRRIGFRTVEVDTAPDATGRPFTLRVNGTPVFVRGANWIPDDVFPARVTRERYARRLRQGVDAGVNLLRVWGGGRYESEDFYDLADGLGLMVGQDFLFACAAYPEEEPLASEVAAEAREQVVRLMPHPSLVWWVGNNENIWGYHDWGWPAALDGRTWGEGYYLDVLPRVVAAVDPTRPYWPGSPYSGDPAIHPNDPAHGTMHIWDVWNTEDYLKYREYRPRFVAEFGFQGPPAYATLRRAVSDDPLAPDSPGLLHHQKAADGNGKLARGLAGHFPEPRTFDDWHWATQLNQARAVTFGIEHFRSLRPECMGAIVWQLNDCWPVTSWAAVDGDGRLKPLWYALRRVFADRLVTIQPRDDGLAAVVVNDGAEPWQARFEVVRAGFDGVPLAKHGVEVDLPAGSSTTVALPPDVARPGDPSAELLVADADGTRATWFYRPDRDLAYPIPACDVSVTAAGGGYRVEVTARALVRDLALFPDRLDPTATVDDALVTLLPGESTTFVVGANGPLDPSALAAPPVLRSANDLGRDPT
jgi:beta-mannosidase